jgi:hypothetical protein
MNIDPATGAPGHDVMPVTVNLGEVDAPPADVNLLTIEVVQKYLNRSRASVYRYANTSPDLLNLPFDARKLNPEVRRDKDDPLLFRPREVRRFAEEVLGLNPTIKVEQSEQTVTQDLLRQILQELQAIHQLLQAQPPVE